MVDKKKLLQKINIQDPKYMIRQYSPYSAIKLPLSFTNYLIKVYFILMGFISA